MTQLSLNLARAVHNSTVPPFGQVNYTRERLRQLRYAAPLHERVEWLRHYERFWNTRLDALEVLLRAADAPATPARARTRKPSPKTRTKR